MTRLRWAILGIGRFGLMHAHAVRSLVGCELTAICNRNPARLRAAAEQLNEVAAYGETDRLLADPAVDVVSITTHWEDHFQAARDALRAGKHVFLEKPMAATARQCGELQQIAAQSAGQFMVGHICRFDPRVSLAKQAVDEGRIGRIVSMHARRNLPASGPLRLNKIPPLMGDGIHDVDLMLWLTGRAPTEVYARNVQFGNHRYPEVGWAMLHFGDEAVGVVETNWGLPAKVPTVIDARLEVTGTEGALTIDCAQTGLSIVDGAGAKMVDTRYWPLQHGRLAGVLRDDLEYFAECVRQQRPPAVVTPAEAARAVAVIEAAEQAARQRRAVEVAPFLREAAGTS